jgi:Ca2+-binding EF-hand superfamily protein
VEIEEITRGLSGVNQILTDAECVKLFDHIDVDQSKNLTYKEFIHSLQQIYTGYILHKLRSIIENSGGKLKPEEIFAACDNNRNGSIDVTEFNEMIQLQLGDLEKHEIDCLFQHFDKKGHGNIT